MEFCNEKGYVNVCGLLIFAAPRASLTQVNFSRVGDEGEDYLFSGTCGMGRDTYTVIEKLSRVAPNLKWAVSIEKISSKAPNRWYSCHGHEAQNYDVDRCTDNILSIIVAEEMKIRKRKCC